MEWKRGRGKKGSSAQTLPRAEWTVPCVFVFAGIVLQKVYVMQKSLSFACNGWVFAFRAKASSL